MKKVLLYSIMPEHMLNILNGNKTIEVRKRDLPKWVKEALAQGEVVEGYGYCTKGKPYLEPRECNGEFVWNIHNDFIYHTDLNGKAVVKFEVSGSEMLDVSYSMWTNAPLKNEDIIKKSCLTSEQIEKYSWDGGAYKDLYTHHFTNIQPIEPMEIGEFYGDFVYSDTDEYGRQHAPIHIPIPLKRAPQSFMTAWVEEVGE